MNGFQIGSKRLKVQHKRVHGSNPNLPPHDDPRQQEHVPYEQQAPYQEQQAPYPPPPGDG